MGNRAFIYSANERHNRRTLGVYLHWNGGPDSVVPLIKYCKLRGFRMFDNGGDGLARLVQVMGNFLGQPFYRRRVLKAGTRRYRPRTVPYHQELGD